MRQMEIYRKSSKLYEEKESTIVYYVTIDELNDNTAGIVLETYGVGVTICESGESAVIPNVTFSKSGIFSLIDLLANYLVTPVTVCDVVNDWLGAY